MTRQRTENGLKVVVAVTAAALAFGCAVAADDGVEEPGRTVVLELFTSQGCSSCPPADRLLREIDVDEDGLIPLAFHVDYWDGIGWPDPFASPAWSARQRDYAAAWRSPRVYTPQLVVDGKVDAVGSDRRRVEEVVAAARALPARARVAVTALRDGEALKVAADAALLAGAGDASLELLVAVVDGGHETEVAAGENARRTLRDEHVVRHLERVARLDAASGKAAGTLEVAIEATWNRDALAVVALLQDSESREILGAARARPAPPP